MAAACRPSRTAAATGMLSRAQRLSGWATRARSGGGSSFEQVDEGAEHGQPLPDLVGEQQHPGGWWGRGPDLAIGGAAGAVAPPAGAEGRPRPAPGGPVLLPSWVAVRTWAVSWTPSSRARVTARASVAVSVAPRWDSSATRWAVPPGRSVRVRTGGRPRRGGSWVSVPPGGSPAVWAPVSWAARCSRECGSGLEQRGARRAVGGAAAR